MIPLIDGDVLIYEVGFGVNTGWEGSDPPPFDMARELLENKIANICALVDATAPPRIFLTGKGNFRDALATIQPYKGNRNTPKPFHYNNLRAYMVGVLGAEVVDGMEADDALSLAQINNAKEYGVAIKTHAGKVLLDYEDWLKYSHIHFIIDNKGYVINDTGKGETRKVWLLHRDIMGNPEGYVVDHINGDKLDNRKYNLRVCSVKENIRNSKSQNGTSKYKGVHWDSSREKWFSSIKFERKNISLGRFDSEEKAAKAYDEAAKMYFGEYARLNFEFPYIKPFKETIICSRDKDLMQVPLYHYSWECGKQPSFGPFFVDGYGELSLDDKRKLKGYGNKFFLAQCLLGDRTDNILGIPKYGAVAAFNLLSDTKTYEEGLEAVREAYKGFYGDDGDKYLLENGRLLWMTRELNEDGTPVLWKI